MKCHFVDVSPQKITLLDVRENKISIFIHFKNQFVFFRSFKIRENRDDIHFFYKFGIVFFLDIHHVDDDNNNDLH